MASVPAKIDWKEVELMLKAGCSGVEIAGHLGVHENTLYNRCVTDNDVEFVEFKRQKKANGDAMIKVAQYKKALKGDNTMLIWMGKNRLGQSDKVHQDIDLYEPPNVRFVERQEEGQEQPSEDEGE